MKRNTGFTLIEVLVAVALMLIIMAATLRTLSDAIHANEGVTLMADTQENLRASLNYMTKDIIQAGEGIPQGGITIPNSGGGAPVSALNRPLPVGAPPPVTFPVSWPALPAIEPGFQLGLPSLTPNPLVAGGTIVGTNTDMITVLYADTTLQDAAGNWLNRYPIRQAPAATCAAAPPSPNGTIVTVGGTTTIAFDPTCININTGNTAINVGDLILLQNNASGCGSGGAMVASDSCDANTPSAPGNMALLAVTGVNLPGNTITLGCGDAFALNCSGQPAGTITQIQAPAGLYSNVEVTATRVWMVTYYISNANPLRPMLMRQINFNPAQPVGEVIENINIFYDVLAAGSSPPTLVQPYRNEAPTYAQTAYIRDCYIVLFARSENPYSQTGTYFRNNLQTVVSIRGLDFYNEFQ
jgi:prepilin-type N-terminal cleavage/methylation domain-containing protein